MSQYGAAMLQVQMFEMTLATLVAVAEHGPRQDLRRSIKRTWHLFSKASASEMKRRLKGKVEAELFAEIVELIGWRDYLTHRYLRQRLFDPAAPSVMREDATLLVELLQLGEAFAEISNRVNEVTFGIVDASSASEAPEAVRAALTQAGRSLVSAQPPRFSRSA
jgi:hypothetical protein